MVLAIKFILELKDLDIVVDWSFDLINTNMQVLELLTLSNRLLAAFDQHFRDILQLLLQLLRFTSLLLQLMQLLPESHPLGRRFIWLRTLHLL